MGIPSWSSRTSHLTASIFMKRKVWLDLKHSLVSYSALKLYRKENTSARLGANLRRIFLERGLDFLDKYPAETLNSQATQAESSKSEGLPKADSEEDVDDDEEINTMTYEDLRDVRDQIMGKLA